jgi:RimJ/RimL family protein N-acetyltransferase
MGSTRKKSTHLASRRVAIGWTWLAPRWWRTGANVECKYLMLEQTFERWRCIRVELRADALNLRSRRAILALGAREEGTLRQHMIVPGGRRRDSVYYSILDAEWPAVRERLLGRLGWGATARAG